jgi:hypothetical protein
MTDRIHVMSHGRGTEEGDPASPISQAGVQAELFTLRASGYVHREQASGAFAQPDDVRTTGGCAARTFHRHARHAFLHRRKHRTQSTERERT